MLDKRVISYIIVSILLLSCNGVPNKAPRKYIEDNFLEGELHFITSTPLDSTVRVDSKALKKMHDTYSKDKRFRSNFGKPKSKTLYFTKLLYTVTSPDGTVDTLRQTVYTDKEQTEVYGIKNY